MYTQKPEPIRRRPDGSIDTAFYAAKAHTCRSGMAHRALASMVRRISNFLTARSVATSMSRPPMPSTA